jgi:hydrogenase 3 maturation protease
LLRPKAANSKIAIIGIGNTFRSDDAAGNLVARALLERRFVQDLKHVLVMDSGHAPENSTAELRRFAPETVLLIDAAEMNETPGTIRWIDMEELDGMSSSTHSLPLSMLARYLTLEFNCDVLLLGIQPLTTAVGESVSEEVLESVDEVVRGLISLLSARIE